MVFGWSKASRRKRILARAESAEIRPILQQQIWQWNHLPKNVQDAAVDWLRIFIEEKFWEGSRDLELTFEHQVVIAGQASFMTLAYPDWYFDKLQTVLIRPSVYVSEDSTLLAADAAIPLKGTQASIGQTSYRGTLLLSWKDVLRSAHSPNFGRCVAIHELAHQMDFDNDPMVDGIPPLPSHVDSKKWQSQFSEQFESLRHDFDQGYDIVIDEYGLTSPGEFFAVASEAYFQAPHELAEYHAELFDLLLSFYQRDWRDWLPSFQ